MTARSGRTWARLGLLATTFALAIALVVGAWLNYRGALAAVSTLNRGQADLLESVRAYAGEAPASPHAGVTGTASARSPGRRPRPPCRARSAERARR